MSLLDRWSSSAPMLAVSMWSSRLRCSDFSRLSDRGTQGFGHSGTQGFVHRCTQGSCTVALGVSCAGALSLDLLDPMVWYGDLLVGRDRLGSRVDMELGGRQVCLQ